MTRQIEVKQENIGHIFFMGGFIVCLILLRSFYITHITGPFIYADEFGYWSHAAHLTGNIWAGAMDGVSWYSFGYSLWLAVTFLFSNQMIVMYRIAIGMNILMSLGVYALVYGTVRKLAKDQDVVTCEWIAFAVTCFPTYIFYSYTTMCETLGTLVIWLLFYELILLEENPVWWKGLLLGATAGYAFMVHNRMLTALLAVGVCLAVLWILHKIDWKIIAAFAASVMVMLLLYVFLKDFLEDVVVNNQVFEKTQTTIARGTANTFAQVWRKFLANFTPQNMVKPIVSLMGQLWHCLSSTYLLAGFGMIYLIRRLMKNVRRGVNVSACTYPLGAFIFSVGLTSVISYGPERGTPGRVRIDPAFYGRYNECYYPLLIMMALLFLCSMEWRSAWKQIAGVAAGYFVLSVGMYFRLYGLEGYLNIVSAVSIHIFHWLGEFSVWKCTGIALFGCGIIVGVCCFKRLGRLAHYVAMTVLTVLFFATALYCMRTAIRGENDYTMQYTPLFDYLNENTEKREVVYITTNGKPAFDLQSRLVDKPVVVMWPENLDTIDGTAYVVTRGEELEKAAVTNYEVCLECEEFLVIRLNRQDG